MKFRCVRDCFMDNKLYLKDTIVETDTIIKCDECKGAGCPICRGTGRKSPSHHFEPLQKEEKAVQYVEEEKEDIDALRKKFDDHGIAYDRRWGVTRLQMEWIKAEKEGRLKEKENEE